MRTHYAVAVFLTLFLGLLMHAAPDRGKPPKRMLPELTGPLTNWGVLTQSGKNFRLDDHPQWFGIGVIRDDGSVYLLWTQRSNDEPCPGVYRVTDDGELVGTWGYSSHVTVEKDGSLSGRTMPDRVYRVKPDL